MYVVDDPISPYPSLIHPKPTRDYFGAMGISDGHNSIYAVDAPMASDVEVSDSNGTAVMMDSYSPIDMNFVKSPQVGYHTTEMLQGDGNKMTSGHFFGYASCQWLAPCDTSQKVGSTCSGTPSDVATNGYCFLADDGSLQCGRLSAMDDEYGEKPIAFDNTNGGGIPSNPGPRNVNPTIVASTPGASGTAYRCPAGSPAKGTGTYVSKRTLVGGCMITTDSMYSVLADVHVPGTCSSATDYLKGCMTPSAINFDPHAKQPDASCQLPLTGCIVSTAVNYNSHATMDDGSCINAVQGCTVQPATYPGGGTDTPMFKSGVYRANEVRGVAVSETVYGAVAVTNYDSSANVNSECVIAIEGCKESDAVNYDPQANTNSFTWCVPKVNGCMMPSDLMLNSGVQTWKENGLSSSYSPSATVHDKMVCVGSSTSVSAVKITRVGCMDSTSVNYDPAANEQDLSNPYAACYSKVQGCLNKMAQNYNCASRFDSFGTKYSEPCPPSSPSITVHNKFLCVYQNELNENDPRPPNPAPPPNPPAPTGQVWAAQERFFLQIQAPVQGTKGDLTNFQCHMVSALTALLKEEFKCPLAFFRDTSDGAIFASDAGRRLQDTTATLVMEKEYANQDEAAAAESNIPAVTTNEMATAFAAQGVAGVEALSPPTSSVSVQITYVLQDVKSSSEDSTGAIVGGVIGGLFGVLIVVGGVIFMKKRQASKTTTVVPA